MFFVLSQIPRSEEIQKQLTAIHIDSWLKQEVFIFRWWLLIGLIILYIFIWWKLLDKPRLNEILLYVVLATIIMLGIVEYGEELILWDYPIDILPIFPPLSSISLISLPLIYSLIYQHFTVTKNFLKATSIATAIVCFVCEPMYSEIGLFNLLHWKSYYSFLLYLLMAIIVREVVIKIYKITEKYSKME